MPSKTINVWFIISYKDRNGAVSEVGAAPFDCISIPVDVRLERPVYRNADIIGLFLGEFRELWRPKQLDLGVIGQDFKESQKYLLEER